MSFHLYTMRKIFILAIPFASLASWSICNAADMPPKHAEIVTGEAAQMLDATLTEAAKNGFSGAVIVENKGVPILSAGYSYASRENRTPFTVNTIAQIGSITKSMTALAILELAHEGKLDLEKPVKAYLPGAAEPAGSATLHQLLTHHAGLADYCGDDFDRLTKEDLLTKCMAKPLAHPVDEDNYSNMGYSILAAVVEKVSGKNWESYLREHIWEPLNMHRTGLMQFDNVKQSEFATGYLEDKPQEIISE